MGADRMHFGRWLALTFSALTMSFASASEWCDMLTTTDDFQVVSAASVFEIPSKLFAESIETRLSSASFVPITEADARQLIGPRFHRLANQRTFLARAGWFYPSGGRYRIYASGRDVVVFHGSLGAPMNTVTRGAVVFNVGFDVTRLNCLAAGAQ